MYAPAVEIDGAVVVATRDRVALRVVGEAVERLIQPTGTDFSPVVFASPNILDLQLLVVAGRGGRLWR